MAVAVVGADKKGGKRRLGPAVMLGLLGASLLAACAPLGPQTVEPIVEQANTTEAGATIPTYAELVAEAMGGGFDPESLEPGKAAALEQLRQTFFIREYDTDGDQQLDGPILSELGENTVQWAVDGVTPYLAGEKINDVYGGGTDTALLESGFRPGEPLVLSVAGANAELANQGVPANGVHLVVMSPTQAVVTDERSNPVAEVGADGVWRAMEVMVTEVPTETPEPTPEPTEIPATETPEPTATMATTIGMQNAEGQWWDGDSWEDQQALGSFVFTGSEFRLRQADNTYESVVFPPELISEIQDGNLRLADFTSLTSDNAVYQAFDSDGALWRIINVEDMGEKHIGAFKLTTVSVYPVGYPESLPMVESSEFQSAGSEVVRLENTRIVSVNTVDVSGLLDGNPITFTTTSITYEYKNPDDSISRITAPTLAGRIWSTDNDKWMGRSELSNKIDGHLAQLTISVPEDTDSGAFLARVREGIVLGSINHQDVLTKPHLMLVINPPYNFGSDQSSQFPGTIFSIHIQPNF